MKKLLLLLALIPAFFSCKREVNHIITPSFYVDKCTFKAADSGYDDLSITFMENDLFGINVVDGGAYTQCNAKYYVHANRKNVLFESNKIILDNDNVAILAYSPYVENFDPNGYIDNFTVALDQSTDLKFKQNNLIVAVHPSVDSDDEVIILNTVSQVVRLELTFSGDTSRLNQISNVIVNAKVGKTSEFKDEIKMCKTGSGTNKITWSGYIPAQSFKQGEILFEYNYGYSKHEFALASPYAAEAGTVKRFTVSLN